MIRHDQTSGPRPGRAAATASRITSVTASGCEIMITCEPSTSVIVAPARSRVGADDVGPGGPVGRGHDRPRREVSSTPVRRTAPRTPAPPPAVGWPRSAPPAASGQVRGERVARLARIDRRTRRRCPRPRPGSGAETRAVPRTLSLDAADDLAQSLTLVRRERRDVHQTHHVAAPGRRVRDHRAPVGVADRKDRAGRSARTRSPNTRSPPRCPAAGSRAPSRSRPCACSRSITPVQLSRPRTCRARGRRWELRGTVLAPRGHRNGRRAPRPACAAPASAHCAGS